MISMGLGIRLGEVGMVAILGMMAAVIRHQKRQHTPTTNPTSAKNSTPPPKTHAAASKAPKQPNA